MFDRYTEGARRALFFARYELGQLGGSTIENDHILLGLVRQPRDTVSRILEQWNVPVADLRVQLEAHARHGDRIATSVEVPFSASTTRVLNLAADEADRLVHMDVECAHLLLGLLHEKDSFAATALAKYGLSLEGVRAYVAAAVAEDESRRSPTPAAAHSL